MPAPINIGGIYADLDVRSDNMVRGLAAGRQAMAAINAELDQLTKDLDSGSMDLMTYTGRMLELNRTAAELSTRMHAANAAVGVTSNGLDILNQRLSTAGNAFGNADSRARAFSRGLMQAGYMLDDVQYGLTGVINNIAPFSQAMAQAAGASAATGNAIAAGLQVAVVVAYQLYQHWDQLNEAMGLGKVRSEAEEMEYLAQKTHKTADETERLNKLKREQQEIDHMMSARPADEVERGKDVEKTITEGDPLKIEKGLFETLKSQGRGSKLTPEEFKVSFTEALDELAPDLLSFLTGTSRYHDLSDEDKKAVDDLATEKATAREDTETHAMVKSLMHDASTDPGKLKQLMAIVKSNPGAFPSGFLETLEAVTPEAHKTKKEKAKEKKDADEKLDNSKKADAAWEKDAKSEADFKKKDDKWLKEAEDQQRALDKDEADAAKKTRKEALAKGKDAVPGLEKMAMNLTLQAMTGGGTQADVTEALRKQLAEAKDEDGKPLLTKDEQAFAAHDASAEGRRKAGEKVMGHAYREAGQEERSTSEIYATSDLTHRIQSSISNKPDTDHKHLSNEEQMIKYLAAMAGRPYLNPGADT